jgi:hypothetical protein
MPSPKHETGLSEKLLQVFDQRLLEDCDEITILRAAFTTPAAYIRGEQTQPLDDVIVMHLALAGLFASNHGGASALAPYIGGPNRRSPAARDVQDFLKRFWSFITGVEEPEGQHPADVNDLRRFKSYVHLGLEAYGIAPSSQAKVGRPARGFAKEYMRQELAFHATRLRLRRMTRQKVIKRAAKQRQAYPKSVAVAQFDERLLEAEFKNLEKACPKNGEMSAEEIARRRSRIALTILLYRRSGKALPDSLRSNTKGDII